MTDSMFRLVRNSLSDEIVIHDLEEENKRLTCEVGYLTDLIHQIRRRCKASAICINEDILKMTEKFNQDEE